jgi:hypothetical protein
MYWTIVLQYSVVFISVLVHINERARGFRVQYIALGRSHVNPGRGRGGLVIEQSGIGFWSAFD